MGQHRGGTYPIFPSHPYRQSLPVRYSGAQYLFRQSVRLTPLSFGQLSALHSTAQHLKTADKNATRKKIACFHPINIYWEHGRKKAAKVRDAQNRSTLILSSNPKREKKHKTSRNSWSMDWFSRENLHRKPMGFLPSNWSGFPVKNFPSSNSMSWVPNIEPALHLTPKSTKNSRPWRASHPHGPGPRLGHWQILRC